MHICGIWDSDCWPVCSIGLICHPSRTAANEDLLIVWSLEVFPHCESSETSRSETLCEGPHSDLEYVVFLSSIGKRAEVGQMW